MTNRQEKVNVNFSDYPNAVLHRPWADRRRNHAVRGDLKVVQQAKIGLDAQING
jgi:hypothetical protein